MFNFSDFAQLENYLMIHPKTVMAVCLLLLLLTLILGRKGRIVLLAGYLVFILYMTVLTREPTERRINLELFRSYRTLLTGHYLRKDVIFNIILFVPYGALLRSVMKKKGAAAFFLCMLLGAASSCAIELGQYIFRIGLCEVDDMFGNSMGFLIGMICYLLCRTIFRGIRKLLFPTTDRLPDSKQDE